MLHFCAVSCYAPIMDKKERPTESKVAIGILMAVAVIAGLFLVIHGLIGFNNSL
jgi:hypothetical protein